MYRLPHPRAVFLDRDGILNQLVTRDGAAVSPRRVADFRLHQSALDVVPRLRGLGFEIFVATNQPDIARGLLNPRELAEMTCILCEALPLQEVVVCPHDDDDECPCRKPKPGMLVDLASRWQVALSESFLIGDSWKDIEAGRRAGCRTILVGPTLAGGIVPDILVPNLEAAADAIEAHVLAPPGGHR